MFDEYLNQHKTWCRKEHRKWVIKHRRLKKKLRAQKAVLFPLGPRVNEPHVG